MNGSVQRSATTLLISHPDCARHDTGPGHPESPDRLEAINPILSEAAHRSDGRLRAVEGRPATRDEIALVHPESHIERIRAAAQRAGETGRLLRLDADTVVSPGSWQAALAAAGAVLTAVDSLLDGSAENAFCAVRPPGHHATANRAMGFCLFNNVAVGVRYAQSKGLERALILDWDVHHGNGTQEIFYADATAYYLSMHQSPLYPGTGHDRERGRGPGLGYTLNLPLPPSLPAERYTSELRRGLDTALSDFRPDIIFVSAGFDAALGDPLAGLTLTPADYAGLTHHLLGLAATHCEGRLVSALEGGYDLELLARCALAHAQALSRTPLG